MIRNARFTYRFYLIGCLVAILFGLGYSYPASLTLAQAIIIGLLVAVIIEYLLLRKEVLKVSSSRSLQEKYALGDDQAIRYQIMFQNIRWPIRISLWDNMDEKFQQRNPIFNTLLSPKEREMNFEFPWKPTTRGDYNFGDNVLIAGLLFPYLIKVVCDVKQKEVSTVVLPSFIQMKKYELQVFGKLATMQGIRRVRQLGVNDEFETIRPYSSGDNIKSINWKAVSKRRSLMVNQYQDTRSQSIYCIIDKGRSMRMPFDGLTLLDHSINATLVLSNIILKKYDKVGVITFDTSIDPILKAERKDRQIEYVSNYLANQTSDFLDSNYELLYFTLRRQISKRSIYFFFCNFELMVDLERNLNYLKGMNQRHLMIAILFINTELVEAATSFAIDKKEIYIQTMIKDAVIEKERIAHRLRSEGIQVVLTKPEDLNINVINSYLSVKARNMR